MANSLEKRQFMQCWACDLAVALVRDRWDEMRGDAQRIADTATAIADALWQDINLAAPPEHEE